MPGKNESVEINFDLEALVSAKPIVAEVEGQDDKDRLLNTHVEAVRALGPAFASFNADLLIETFPDKDERIVVMGRVRQVMENLRSFAPQDFAHLKGVLLSNEFEGIDADGMIHFDTKYALGLSPQEITNYSKSAQGVLTEYGKTRKDATRNRIRKETTEIASELNRAYLLPRGRDLYGPIRQPAEQLAFLKNLRILLSKLAHKLKGVAILYGSTNDVFEDGLHLSPSSILNLKQDRDRIDRLAEELRDGLANITNPIKLDRPTEKDLRRAMLNQEKQFRSRGAESDIRNKTFLAKVRALASEHPQFEERNILMSTDQLSSHDRVRLMGIIENLPSNLIDYTNAEGEEQVSITPDKIFGEFHSVSLSPRFTRVDRTSGVLVLGIRDLLNGNFLTSPAGKSFRKELFSYINTPEEQRGRKSVESEGNKEPTLLELNGIGIRASDIRRVITEYANAQSKFTESEPSLGEAEDMLKVNKARLVSEIPPGKVGSDFARLEYTKGDRIRMDSNREDMSWRLKVPESRKNIFEKYLFLRENFRLLAGFEDMIQASEDEGAPIKIDKKEAREISLAYANLKWFSENQENFYLLEADTSQVIKTADQAYRKSENANQLFEGRQDIAILVASDRIPLKAMDITFGRAREILELLGDDASKVKGVMVDRPGAQVKTPVRFHDGILYIPFFEVVSGKNLGEFAKKVKAEIAEDNPRETIKDFPAPDYPPAELQESLFSYTTEIASHLSSPRIEKYKELLKEAEVMDKEGIRRPEDQGALRVVRIRTEPNSKGELALELERLDHGSANYVLKVPKEVKETYDAWSELSKEIAEIAPYISDLEEQAKERQAEIKMKFWKIQKKYNQYITREWLNSDEDKPEVQ